MSITQETFQNISNGNRHFKNVDLSAIDTSEYFEKDFLFENCQFFNVSFNGITIEKLHASHCEFLMCDFDKTTIGEAIFEDCKFYDPKTLKGSCFKNADLRRSIFKNCDISGCNFQRANLFQCEFHNCKAQGTDFKFVDFTIKISRTLLMAQAILKNNNFRYACFEGVYLKGCDLSESVFINTDFTNAVLDECDFTNSVFSSPILLHTTFNKADFRNANISGIELSKIAFSGIKIFEWQASDLLEEYGIIVLPHAK